MIYGNHGSVMRLAGRFLGSKGMRMGGVYLMSANEYKRKLFGDEKKLSGKTFWSTSKCVEDLDFGCCN